MYDDDEKERKDDKGKGDDKDDDGSIAPPLDNHFNGQDCTSDSDSDSDSDGDDENKQRNRVDPKDAPMIDPMKYIYGFLSGSNSIFGDKNDKGNRSPKKTRKMGSSHSSRVNDILDNADDSRDINNNVTISNIDSTHRQERATNDKRDSKFKSRSSYKKQRHQIPKQ